MGVDDDVRTPTGKCAEWAQEIVRELKTDDGQRIMQNISCLRQRFEPEVVAKEGASRVRRVKGARSIYRARGDDASFVSPLPT